MDKTKELIETWKKFKECLDYTEDSFFFMADEYCCRQAEFDGVLKELNKFKDLRQKMDELIKSLEAKNGHSN